jgi:hypothetical protein
MLLMQELFFIAQKTAKSLHSLMKQYRIDSVPGEKYKIGIHHGYVRLPSDLVFQEEHLLSRVLEYNPHNL